MNIAERYVVDEKGQKMAVILSIDEYEKLQEDRHDPDMVAERRGEGTITLHEMKKRFQSLSCPPIPDRKKIKGFPS